MPDLRRKRLPLSRVLRHHPCGLSIRPDGYFKCNEILKLKHFKSSTLEHLQHIVTTDTKMRYSMCEIEGELYIKANQGHSIFFSAYLNDNLMMIKLDLSAEKYIYHGTDGSVIDLIMKDGLKSMDRIHIHFVTNENPAFQLSGFRSKSNIIITVDMHQAMIAGFDFFQAPNGVILTRGIDGTLPITFITNVTKRS